MIHLEAINYKSSILIERSLYGKGICGKGGTNLEKNKSLHDLDHATLGAES
jgi:hypothetical protein